MLRIKLRQEGHKRLISYSILILKKKKNIQSAYEEKIGTISYFKPVNNMIIYISKNKLKKWRYKGVLLDKKFMMIFKHGKSI